MNIKLLLMPLFRRMEDSNLFSSLSLYLPLPRRDYVQNQEKREWNKEIREEKQKSNLIKITFSLLMKSLLLLYSSRLKSHFL